MIDTLQPHQQEADQSDADTGADTTASVSKNEPLAAEHVAYQEDGTLIISGRWTRNLKEGTVTCRVFELMWNYMGELFTPYSYSYEVDLQDDGETVEHSGKHWIRHAEDTIQRTVELRPRTDGYYRVSDVTSGGIQQWTDPKMNHEEVARKIERES